jgi:hypothetical protein
MTLPESLHTKTRVSDGWTSKLVLAIVSAALGAIGSLVVARITAKEPQLVVAVEGARTAFGENRVQQFVTIRNDGKELAKDVTLSVKSLQGRLYESGFTVVFDPPRLSSPPTVDCDQQTGDCVWQFGDLKPKAYITIRLTYKRPTLTNADIETHAENAIATIEVLPSTVASRSLLDNITPVRDERH